MNESLLKILQDAPLDQLGDVVKIIAEKIHSHKAENHGFVPRDVFLPVLAIAGVYACADIVVIVQNQSGVALKKRDNPNEASSELANLYQIPGAICLFGDSAESVLSRTLEEIFGPLDDSQCLFWLSRLKLLGVEIHPEPWRNCYCISITHELTVDSLDDLIGTWEVFTDLDDARIVGHQAGTLKWLKDLSDPQFGTLGNGIK